MSVYMYVHLYEYVCVCVHCCFYVLAPVCPKIISQHDYCIFFTKLHISLQAISDTHKMMVVLRIWDMTVCD